MSTKPEDPIIDVTEVSKSHILVLTPVHISVGSCETSWMRCEKEVELGGSLQLSNRYAITQESASV